MIATEPSESGKPYNHLADEASNENYLHRNTQH